MAAGDIQLRDNGIATGDIDFSNSPGAAGGTANRSLMSRSLLSGDGTPAGSLFGLVLRFLLRLRR